MTPTTNTLRQQGERPRKRGERQKLLQGRPASCWWLVVVTYSLNLPCKSLDSLVYGIRKKKEGQQTSTDYSIRLAEYRQTRSPETTMKRTDY